MTLYLRTLLSTVLLFLGSLTSLTAQDSLFYRVSHPEHPQVAPSYLFGTFHLMKSGYFQNNYSAVQEAFEKAEMVVVETVIDSSKLMELASLVMMKSGAITDYLSDAQWDTLKQRLSSYPYPEAALRKLKPMQHLLMLTMKEYQSLETAFQKGEGQPVDLYFAQQAKVESRNLRPLETMMDQMRMLYQRLPDSLQAQMLREALEDPESMAPLTRKMADYYQQGKLRELGRLYQENQESFQEMSFLVKPRNKRWMPELEEILQSGNAFIAVGALHLPLEGGLLELLKAKGYKLEPLSRR